MKFFTRITPKLLGIVVFVTLAAYAVFSFVVMKRPKGLRIHAPEFSANIVVNSGNSVLNTQTFASIDPVAFTKIFGLDFNKKPEVKIKKVVKKKPEPKKKPKPKPVIQASAPAVLAPKSVDLHALGYRLKGIIFEKGGNSAAFLIVPKSKKTVIVREKSAGEIRLISATMRSVKIETPDGTGELELDYTKGSKDIKMGNAHSLATTAGSSTKNSAVSKSATLLQQTQITPNDIAKMISSGNFQVRYQRGKFMVDVRQVPNSFSGYGLKPGDKIIGTGNGDFRQSQDVALELGNISQRPVPIKIQRGRQIMFLHPPPPSEHTPSRQFFPGQTFPRQTK